MSKDVIEDATLHNEIEMSAVDIRDKAEEAFDNYAKELLLERAFPDFRDGLTPVQRRIIFGMYKMGLSYKNGKPARQVKSARIIGDVMGKYHPHGDCLHKDTEVYLASGETRRIEDLYNETQKDPGKTFEAYSLDDKGKLVRSEISHLRIGQYTDDIYEVKLSNGHIIRTTSNHPFLTYDNNWVKAEDLTEGTPLANTRLTDSRGYSCMRVFNKENKKFYSLLDLVKEDILINPEDKKLNLHHINQNKKDNRRCNVTLLNDTEHALEHKDYLKGLDKGRQSMFRGENRELRDRIKLKNSRLMKSYNQQQYLHKALKVVGYIQDAGLEVNNETYNQYRVKVYNGTTIDRLFERGDIKESVSELVGKEFKTNYIDEVIGLTKDLGKKEDEQNKPTIPVNKYRQYNSVLDAVMEVYRKGKELTYETYWEERVGMLTHKDNRNKIVPIDDIHKYLEDFGYEGIVYVDSVEVVKVAKEPMYDFTVNEYENALFVANGNKDEFIALHNSGIYGAMTKMGKEWVFEHPLIELIGNNGSDDGDNPASMRYTLARLSNNAKYLTDGLNKDDVVDWKLTYEDTDYEPVYLPAQYPNLLVNGSVGGIAIGYVVDILPHNLAEVLKISIQDAKGEELDAIAPDFPTGGVIVNGNELEDMYNTGIGKAVVRGRYKVETDKSKRKNKRSIIFYDVPYGVQKSKCVDKIQEMIANNGTSSKQQLTGAVKAQDESGSDGLRIAVNVTDDADIDVVTELIYKHTLLEKSQRYEFLTIINGQPRRVSLKRYIKEFNKFRRNTIKRELEADNRVIDTKVMRLDALIKLDGVRDEVIACIRNSNNKAHAIENIVEQFDYTEEQADYLLSLQLSRLTKDNYDKYRADRDELLGIRKRNLDILASPDKVNDRMIAGYEALITEIGKERQTKVLSEVREVNLTIDKVVQLEDTVIGVTPDGQIKRSSTRSYGATQNVGFEVYDLQATTHDELVVFTDRGQVAVIQVKDVPEMRWGDIGEPLMTFAKNFHLDEKVIGIGVKNGLQNIMLVTNDNRVKVMLPTEFGFKTTSTFYNVLPVDEANNERVIGVSEVNGDTTVVVTATNKRQTMHYGLAFKAGEVAPSGRSAKGRKLASISQSKLFDKVYLSGDLPEDAYREVGKAPVKDVYPVDVPVNADTKFVSNTIHITNQPVAEVEVVEVEDGGLEALAEGDESNQVQDVDLDTTSDSMTDFKISVATENSPE